MSNLDLDAIEARVNAATEGPWKVSDLTRPTDKRPFLWIDIDRPDEFCTVAEMASDEAGCEVVWGYGDAEFIAHARTDIPALLAEVRRLRVELADAWDEGYNAGHETARAVNPEWPEPSRNPYRQEQP